jgi:hypothetical protein
LKPVSANATIGISAKCQNDEVVLGVVGLCVHVDTTPVNISVCEEQVRINLKSFAERKWAFLYAVNSALCFFVAIFLISLFLIIVMNSSFIHYIAP